MGDIEEAGIWYGKALERGIGLADQAPLASLAHILDWVQVFQAERPTHCTVKAACNLSVCYEKLGNREAALEILKGLKQKLTSSSTLMNEYSVYLEGLANNLGVIQRRNGDIKDAEESYKLAISLQVHRADDDKTQTGKPASTQNYSVTSSPHRDSLYRMSLIRFFPIYNLAVSHSKAAKFDEALQTFKDALQ